MEIAFHLAIVGIGVYIARKICQVLASQLRGEFALTQILYLNLLQAKNFGLFSKEATA